jgi:hypothetical protein
MMNFCSVDEIDLHFLLLDFLLILCIFGWLCSRFLTVFLLSNFFLRSHLRTQTVMIISMTPPLILKKQYFFPLHFSVILIKVGWIETKTFPAKSSEQLCRPQLAPVALILIALEGMVLKPLITSNPLKE